MGFRTIAAVWVCKATYHLMQLAGRNGRALPGKIALKIQPDLMAQLARGRDSIVITGTNGKTTTTHIIQQCIINEFGGCAYDPTSTNLSQGVATTLSLDSTLTGKPRHRWAVIESDEGATKRILPALEPKVLVVTNLYRDQVDRYATQTTARDYIVDALRLVPDTVAVLDADCQVVSSLADLTDNPVVWYGVETQVYEEGIADQDSHVRCVFCGGEMEFGQRTFAHLGEFSCPECGYRHSDASIATTAVGERREKDCQLTMRVDGQEHQVDANVRAGYDIYNVTAAVAGLVSAGIPVESAFAACEHFQHAMHRFEIFDIQGTPVRLLLVKNTAGCNQIINMLLGEDHLPKHLVCLLGNEIMDGFSTDWIQEVCWEKLVNRETEAMVGGPCLEDMLDRLVRAGVPAENIRIQADYPALIQEMGKVGEQVTVIANCSTIENLRVELTKEGYKPLDYWDDDAR